MNGYINRLNTLLMFILCIFSISVLSAEDTPSDLDFSAIIGWAWRDINGTMFSYTPPLNGAATADSLGLGSSSELNAVIGLHWKRLNLEFVYLPSRFKGDGVLLQELDFGSGPIINETTPINSNIEVTMMLANIEYLILQRGDMDLGLGVGIGQVKLDIAMTPQVGSAVNINGNVPFGYLTTSLTKRWGRTAFSFGLQGLSVSQNGTNVTYKSMNLAGSYHIYQRGNMGFDILGGYHYVNFDYGFNDNNTTGYTNTDFVLTGPFVGVRATW